MIDKLQNLLVGLFGKPPRYDAAKAKREYEEEIAEANRAGLPLTAAELRGQMPLEAQNAAPLYKALEPLLKSHLLKKYQAKRSDAWNELLAEREVEALRAFVTNQYELMRLLHQAVLRPECVFDTDYTSPLHYNAPPYLVLRQSARLLVTESILLARDKRLTEAVHNQMLGFQLGRHLRQSPLMIAQLVAAATDSITLTGVQRLCYLATKEAGVLETIEQALTLIWQPYSVAHALRGEIAFQNIFIESTRRMKPQEILRSNFNFDAMQNQLFRQARKMNETEWNALIDANATALLRYMRRLIASADLPCTERDPLFHTLRMEANQDKKHPLCGQSIDSLSNAAIYATRIQARFEVTRAGAALLAAWARNGRCPHALQEVMPVAPMDPFTGKPLIYHAAKDGFSVYSVGETGLFNGTSDFLNVPKTESAFRYPAPKHLK